MKGSFKDFVNSQSNDKDLNEQFAKYQNLGSDELTKMFFELAKKEKAQGKGDEMLKMIERLRPMLNKDQQKALDSLLKGMK